MFVARSTLSLYNILFPCRKIVSCHPGLMEMIRLYGFSGSCLFNYLRPVSALFFCGPFLTVLEVAHPMYPIDAFFFCRYWVHVFKIHFVSLTSLATYVQQLVLEEAEFVIGLFYVLVKILKCLSPSCPPWLSWSNGGLVATIVSWEHFVLRFQLLVIQGLVPDLFNSHKCRLFRLRSLLVFTVLVANSKPAL
jgi:hypothetical protein